MEQTGALRHTCGLTSMPFKPHPDADWRRASARTLVRLLLDADGLYPSHRKEFLKLALWKVTEAEGAKYNTRYRSLASLQPHAGKLQHEHVYERGKMADALLASPEQTDEILSLAIGCLVTEDEHRQLTRRSKANPDLQGWDRYRNAGIAVFDTSTGQPLDLPHRHPALPG